MTLLLSGANENLGFKVYIAKNIKLLCTYWKKLILKPLFSIPFMELVIYSTGKNKKVYSLRCVKIFL